MGLLERIAENQTRIDGRGIYVRSQVQDFAKLSFADRKTRYAQLLDGQKDLLEAAK